MVGTESPPVATITASASIGDAPSHSTRHPFPNGRKPVTTVPGDQTTPQNVATKIPGVSVADADADAVSTNETITVDLSDTSGLLSATGTGERGHCEGRSEQQKVCQQLSSQHD